MVMLKTASQTLKILLLAVGFLFGLHPAEAQTTRAQKKQAKIDAVKNMVNKQNYVFMAQFANPLGWKTINLNYNYNVVISRDSVDSYLPYYGRAYVAPYNPTDPAQTGIQFKTKKFDYQEDADKKGNYAVTIIPHDVKETRKFFLNISEEGYATLSVTSNNRQSISFTGYITENLPKTKK